MESEVYAVEADIEESHWWFVGRRRLFAREIARLGVPSGTRVLDIGSGTGANLRLLRDAGFRSVTGLDTSREAAAFCARKGLGPVQIGSAERLPFDDGAFGLVLATDVIEHVDDDLNALREMYRVLAPGGHLLLTVPAFQSLWGAQDVIGQHKRRYRMRRLLELHARAGLPTLRHYYFNFLLFLPIWTARRLLRAAQATPKNENELNTPLLNGILGAVFALDTRAAPIVRPPFGVSALVLSRKPT